MSEQDKPQGMQIVLKSKLELIKPSLDQIIPAHSISSDRIIKVVLSAVARTPLLQQCTPMSIVRSVMQAAELGLEIGGLMGEAYLVPFKGDATCIVGYQGLLKLMRNTGQFKSIQSHVVYRGEEFEYDVVENKVTHKRTFSTGEESRDAKDVIAAYTIGIMKDDSRIVDVMSRAELEAIRKGSKMGNGGPWMQHYAEMCRKTSLRRFAKYAPKAVERMEQYQTVLQDIEAVEFAKTDLEEPVPSLKDRVRAKAKAGEVVAEAELVNESTGEVYVHEKASSDEWEEGRD